ncbi:hypothetical protein [Paenibacillus sp. P46E]|uniref:hypothetical protein n=1 Tax=Paenibacillus sp. P46E TaxID=1349436 RepID=UPI000939C1C6|nr:hypothetical protein [Paenibacillus sp. P46E]OKP97797.1 hypothetical protein A3849_13925 [Paenibacillus sp. P46E]
MDVKLGHIEALELIARIQRIINQAVDSDGAKVLAFNLISDEIKGATNVPVPEKLLLAYQVYGENGEDYNDIVFAPSRSKAKYESIAYLEHGTAYALIKALRRPDLDKYAQTGIPDVLPKAP